MIRLSKTRPEKEKYRQAEKPVSDFIPYKCHWDSNTILTKDNALMRVIKITGYSFETADDEDVDLRKEMRNMLFKGLGSGSLTLYSHVIRRKRTIDDGENDYKSDPTVTMPADFISYLSEEWRKKYETIESYVNELYITVLFKPDTAGAAILEHIYKKILQSSDKSQWEQDMREMSDNLDEITIRIENSFRDVDAKLLGIRSTSSGDFCEVLEFLGMLVNCGRWMPIRVPKGDIDKHLANYRLFFGSKALEARGPTGSLYAGIVSVQEYGPQTSAGVLDGFLQMPFEFIMTQSFSFANRSVAIGQMQLQQNRMIQAEDKAISQIAEISEALDLAMSGEIGFGSHHLTVLCVEESVKNLENALSMASVELSNTGIKSVREHINLEPSYWGQLPGNIDYIVRKCTINTLNLAGFVSLHNYPSGKLQGNHWGEYVTVLDTTSGTPYYFSFHVRDVGHTLIIGPTGAGKTVLMNFLCAQAQKFKCRMYFFDKDRGAEIFIRALNGVYTIIDPSTATNFNPFALPDTGENRTFLMEFLKVLVTTTEKNLTPEDIKTLNLSIEGNYKLAPKDRRLCNIVPFLGMDGPGTLASRIAMWHGRGSHASLFDNETDDLDLEKARVFGFEMAELLKDPVSLAPALLYVFHRINISLDGSPTMIVLDEAWALIDNPVFAPKIKDWLKVLRKLNTFVIFATQSVEDAVKSQISDTLIQQTATQIFLPNLKATQVYRTAFMLSQREYTLIKTTDPSSRYFLVKQGVNAIVARVNLSGMDNIINVLSGRAETVLIAEELRKKYGDKPEKWLPHFYKLTGKK